MRRTRPIFDIVAALRLRGMRVLKTTERVITIDNPSTDFISASVEIVECMEGNRRRFGACQFNGSTIRWELN